MYCWFVCINLYEMGSMYRWYHLPYAFVHSPLLHHMWSIVTALFIASRSQNCTFQPQLPPKQLSNDWWFQPIPKVWVMFGSSSQIYLKIPHLFLKPSNKIHCHMQLKTPGWQGLYKSPKRKKNNLPLFYRTNLLLFFWGGINYYKILIIRIYKVKSTRLTIHQAAQITPRPLKPCPSGKPKAESRLAGAVLWMSCVVRGQCEGLSENRYIYGILVYQPQKG